MECRKVRELETAEAIAAHVAGCPTCQAERSDVRRLRASVRSAYLASPELAPRPEFAAALGSRLRASAAPETAAPSWRRSWFTLAATLVLVVGGGFGVRGLGMSGFTAILQAAVGDHRFCLVAFRLTERPLPLTQAARVYDDPVDRPLDTVQPSPVQLSGGPVRILERHSCVFEGRRFAHIVLQYKRELISLVVTPDDRWLRHLPGASAPAGESVTSLPPVDGYHVAAFRGPDHAVFVISALDDADLREVARAMAGPVSGALKVSE